MPKEFDDCQKRGGRIYTLNISTDRYRHICVDPKTGKSVNGEIKYKQKNDANRK